MKKIGKFLVRLVVVIVVLLLLILFLHPLFVGPTIKASVEKIGPMVTQTPMELNKAKVNLFTGSVQLKGLKIGNPEGYKTEAAVKVGAVKIKFDPLSVFSDTIHVKQVYVDAAEAWYEMGIPSSNVGKLQKNVEAFSGGSTKPKEEKPKSDKPDKKVVIDDLQILNTKVHVGVKGTGGSALPIPMPDIKKKDLGKDGEGKSVGEMSAEVLGSMLGGISEVVASAGKAVGDAGKAVGDAAQDAGKAVGDAARDAGKAIKGIFGDKK